MAHFIELAILAVLVAILVKVREICHYTRLILFKISTKPQQPQQPPQPRRPISPPAGPVARRRLRY